MQKTTTLADLELAASLTTADWVAIADNHGPFAQLKLLRLLLFAAPEVAQGSPDYHYIRGLIDGRAIHEELGGI